MNSRCVRKDSRSLSAGASGVMPRGVCDKIAAFSDLQKKRREAEELDAKTENRKQVLESLQQKVDEMNKKLKKQEELYSRLMFLKDEDAGEAVERAEREGKERLQMEAEMNSLKEVSAELMKRTQELQRQVHRHTTYLDFMERAAKMTKFEDAKQLRGHLERLLYFRDQLCQRESEVQQQADQQRNALLRLEEEHQLLWMHNNNQLSQLQTELEKTHSEALTWERQWNHIQQTTAKKTLLLGQIKMATLNLYETIDEKMEGVDMNDAETQLDKIMMFIQDHNDIMKQRQSLSHRHSDRQNRKEQKRDVAKKQITT